MAQTARPYPSPKTMPSAAPFISTLSVANIHCPSCVSYAQDVLGPVEGIYRVDVSVVEHHIQVQHAGIDLGRTIAADLLRAAFEVHHVTTTDANENVVRDSQISPRTPRAPRFWTWPLFMSKAQRKHIENCNACRTKMARSSKKKSIWTSLNSYLSEDAPHDTRFDPKSLTGITGQVHVGKESLNVNHCDGAIDQEKERAGEYTASLSISGMTCASCSGAITNELKSLEIVRTVNVDLLSNSATVIFSRPRANVERFVEVIGDIGYEATISDVQPTTASLSSKRAEAVGEIYHASLSIDGMTCGSCVGIITRGLQELPFVSSIDVDLVGNSAAVEYSGKEGLDQILEKIDDLGYEATPVEIKLVEVAANHSVICERTIQIQIEGMFCEHCPSNITSSLKTSFGNSLAISQTPTLKIPILKITYTPEPPQLTARQFLSSINTVHSAFTASIFHPPSQEDRSRAMKHREQKHISFRLFFTFLVAIPTFVIGVVFMSLVPKSNASKMWLMKPVWAGNVTREEWALFIMTTPVMFYGADLFHTRSFKELRALWGPRSRTPILRRFYRFGSMNLLISAGTSVAYFSSLAVLIMDATSKADPSGRASDTYFDSVTFLTFFILIGRFLEAYSKAKTGDAVALLTKLRPVEALLIEDTSNADVHKTEMVPVDLLEIGDTVNVPYGTSPPTDGIVDQDGTFSFDESSLTGESRPAKKVSGDKVFAGSVNVSQPVRITVTDIGGTSMLDQIVDVVRKGQSTRAPIERIADLLTGYFVPVVTLIAVATWLIWLALGVSGALPRKWLDVKQGGWPFWSLEFAIAVFVVACPCGLGLAAPTALYVGGGLAAKHGILVQGGGEAFQEASKLDVVVFDKTGTLTEGQMKVTNCESINQEYVDLRDQAIGFGLSMALEEASTHPIAKAIAHYAREKRQDLPNVEITSISLEEIPGEGMTGTFMVKAHHEDNRASPDIARYQAAIGNQRLLSTIRGSTNKVSALDFFLEPILTKYQNQGQSTSVMAIRQVSADNIIVTGNASTTNSISSTEATLEDGIPYVDSSPYLPVLVFAISDPLRATTASVLDTLRQKHDLEIHMCTGDNATTARAIASQIGISATNIRAGVLPQDKAAYINELQYSPDGKRRIVAFVGDGTNDTPALSAADVSIALSSGSDVAVGTASFILLNSDLETILQLVHLARRVFMRVKMNFAWAALYNVCLIPIAAGVAYPAGQWRLGPVWASAAMALSSVSVVLSSLALRFEMRKTLAGVWAKKE